MKKVSILVLVLSLFLFVFPLPKTVKADTVLPFNTTVTGEITEQSSSQAYTVTAEEAGTLTINFTVYFSSALLELRGSNNELVGEYEWVNGGNTGNPKVLQKEVNIEPGVYTVFVKDNNKISFGKYDLAVAFNPVHNTETEPNQTFTEAMPIQLNGKRIRGFISANDHHDYYKVEVEEAGRLELDIVSQMRSGTVEFYDAKGDMISRDSLDYYEGTPVTWKTHQDFEAGTYYIHIMGYGSNQGIYEMLVSFMPAKNEEVEPNNNKFTAMPISIIDPKMYTGFLSYTDRYDYYKIDMKFDGYVTINFSSEFSGYQLTDGISINYASHRGSGTIGHPEASSQRIALPKGVYYFVPFAQVSWQSGVYTMSFKAEVDFKDVTSRYMQAVTFLADKEVTNGITKNEFGVYDNIKRVDAAIWLAKILELDQPDSTNTPYLDVPKRAWGAVNALKQANIANGKSATHFGADDTMTRGEMALLLQRAYALSAEGVEHPFIDVAPHYEEAVNALLKNNVTQGKSSTRFGTGEPITRGEMALFLYRVETAR